METIKASPEERLIGGNIYEKFDRLFPTKEGAQTFAASEFKSQGDRTRVFPGSGSEKGKWLVYWFGQ